MKSMILLSVFCLLALPAWAEVETTADADALASVETILVLPLGCGADEDCRDLEDRLTALVEEHLGVETISRADIEKAVERMGMNNPQGHLAYLLAQEVGADAYLRIEGSDTPRQPTGNRGPSAFPTLGRRPGVAFRATLLDKIRAASLEMRTADDTTEVLKGRSKGRRSFVDHVERILREVGG